jgi:hypothetical protein
MRTFRLKTERGHEEWCLLGCYAVEPHGVTTQKTPFFIVTAVKTSNLTLREAILRSVML